MLESNTPKQFIELNRTFHELSAYARESDDVDLSHAFYVSSRVTWSDLVREFRVVLLSEAGSGKTAEIRNVGQNLHNIGKPAFFIRLEHIPNDFEDAFEVGSYDEFKKWLLSGEEGWLLLDSVDEARLRSPGDFELAVRKLGRQIFTAKERVHIVIAGRTSVWRAKTDLAICERHLPFSTPTTTVVANEKTADGAATAIVHTTEQDRGADSAFKIVAFDDLSAEQVKVFASARGISDTTAFLGAVERADAWSFTSRPQDLEELTAFWKDQGWIGSRLDLMRNSIHRRLSERDQDREQSQPIPLEQVREGAQLLAAAATLGHESTIRVPDGAANSKGIPVPELLPEWDGRKQITLLSRPIFDEAIYGTVRFHHRSVREYLTAEWLTKLLHRETSRRKIEALFFRRQYGIDVVVPTLRPVLPWMAILDDKLRERLREVAPEVIFEGGDPSQLPLHIRRTILHEICEQIESGTSSRSVTDYEAVQRFANVDLTDEICSLIKKYEGHDELTGFLLRMIWLGELKAALPEAKLAAMSTSLSIYTRVAAFRAVKAIGSEADYREIRQKFLAEAPELNREWLAELAQDIAPTYETIAWLLNTLAKSAKKRRFSVDRLHDAVMNFVQSADIDLLPCLVTGLDKLLDQPPIIERRFCKLSERFGWLLPSAAHAVERLIQERNPAAFEASALGILRKFRTARAYDIDELRDEKIDFSALIPEWREINRALFWSDIENARADLDKKRGERLDEFWRGSIFETYWRFDESDFEYVAEQIVRQPHSDNRLVALSLAFRLYVDCGRPRNWRDKLKALVAEDSELAGQLSQYLNPPPQDKEAQRWKRQNARWKRKNEENKRKEKKYHDDWEKYLNDNIDKIRNPDLPEPDQISTAQYYLHEQVRNRHSESNRWTDGEWKCLIDEQGEAVARAFRDGVVAYWRRYKPTIRSEGAPLNQTAFPVIFGLTGLSIESRETTNWLDILNAEEVELACRYASYELNGFPTWFAQLFTKYPAPATQFLLDEIKFELSIEKRDVDTHYILSDVSSSGEWTWDELGPLLLDLLQTIEPTNLNNLRRLLTIIQGSSVTDNEIRMLATKKCEALRSRAHLALWYATWTGVDPDAAIPAFDARIKTIRKSKDRTEFAMGYVSSLCGGRSGETSVRGAFQTPGHLKSLYLLMYEHVRREDDIDRAGTGAYSPGLRDKAQEARDSLFTRLNQIPGKEAFLALEEISKMHPEESSRSWIVLKAKSRAEQDADIGQWTPSQVREFQDKHERTPTNHRELAELATMRLLDLKDDLEEGDSSVAQILLGVKYETHIRNYIGRELREKASGRYSIPQEEELADAKRIDLRFLGYGFDGPVPVELKLADKWTGPKLFERLVNQLCGDYLRDIRSNHGLFVLVYRGEKKRWVLPRSTNRVDFSGLVAALRSHWEEVSPGLPNVEDIAVIGIDLTKRFS